MVLVLEVMPQLLAPDVNRVIEQVPGKLNVMFKVVVAVPVQMEGLFGNVPLNPKFPTTVTQGLAVNTPEAPDANIPAGPVICQYLLYDCEQVNVGLDPILVPGVVESVKSTAVFTQI